MSENQEQSAPVSGRESFERKVIEERQRAIAKGFTPEHDAEHGVDHLLLWAIEYLHRDEPHKAAGLILAARDLLRATAPAPVSGEDREAARAILSRVAGLSMFDDVLNRLAEDADPDRDGIAHDIWAMGGHLHHRKCRNNPKHGNDADYENECEACQTYLRAVADSILLSRSPAVQVDAAHNYADWFPVRDEAGWQPFVEPPSGPNIGLNIWFPTESECERFIRSDLHSPVRDTQ